MIQSSLYGIQYLAWGGRLSLWKSFSPSQACTSCIIMIIMIIMIIIMIILAKMLIIRIIRIIRIKIIIIIIIVITILITTIITIIIVVVIIIIMIIIVILEADALHALDARVPEVAAAEGACRVHVELHGVEPGLRELDGVGAADEAPPRAGRRLQARRRPVEEPVLADAVEVPRGLGLHARVCIYIYI